MVPKRSSLLGARTVCAEVQRYIWSVGDSHERSALANEQTQVEIHRQSCLSDARTGADLQSQMRRLSPRYAEMVAQVKVRIFVAAGGQQKRRRRILFES